MSAIYPAQLTLLDLTTLIILSEEHIHFIYLFIRGLFNDAANSSDYSE
jgi:hypothetical protein